MPDPNPPYWRHPGPPPNYWRHFGETQWHPTATDPPPTGVEVQWAAAPTTPGVPPARRLH